MEIPERSDRRRSRNLNAPDLHQIPSFKQPATIVMLELTTRAISACLLLAVCASFALANSAVSGKDGGPSGVFAYSSNPQVATFQRQAKSVVERYQDGLNGSDFSVIRTLFAPNAVAEWNEKATIVGVDAMAGAYGELFKTAKFTTDFQFDVVDLLLSGPIIRSGRRS